MAMSKFLRGSLALLLIFAATQAHAQQLLVWSAQKMLNATSAPSVALVANGGRVDSVQRVDIERLVEITERMAGAMDMGVPTILIAKQSGPNAFATVAKGEPVIAVNTDMLRLTQGDEPMLAAVIGHELAHLKARHTTDGRSRAAAVSLLGVLLGAAVDINQANKGRTTHGLGAAVGAMGGRLVNAKFSRDQEREADEMGLRAMADAGYDPLAVARLWQRMGAGGAGLWFDTHPASSEREQTLHALAQQVEHVYAANARHGAAPVAVGPAEPVVAVGELDSAIWSAFSRLAPTMGEREEGGPYARGALAVSERRFADALEPLKEATNQGDERGMHMLALIHYRGELGSYDWGTARALFEQAAAKGFAPSMTMLGRMALQGKGGEKNPAEAVRQYRLAVARDDAAAAGELAMLLAVGQGVERDLMRAREVAEKAVAAGDIPAKGLLGALLRDGSGGPPDLPRSFALLSEAAPRSSWAKAQLGISYERGLGTGPDREKAISLYTEAAAQGSSLARTRLQALQAR